MREISVASKIGGVSLTGYNTLLAVLAGLLSAALLYFGTGLHPIWWIFWLAPIPVLAVAPRLRPAAAFLLGSIVWFLGELNQWNYFRHVVELPLHMIVVFLAIAAVGFGLGVLVTRSSLQRGSLFLAAFALPVYWVGCEYLNAIASPHSTWGNLAYTQMDFLPLIQIASVTGLWGISFIPLLFATTATALVSGVGKPSHRGALAIGMGLVISAVLVFGEWRLQSNSPAKSVFVTLIAKDVPMSLYVGPEQQALELLHEYADEIRRVARPGTQVVVLPEKIARLSESGLAEADALFTSAATATHTAIVVGVVRRTASGSFNSSRFYSADGKIENYDKHHLIPGVEPEKPGDKRMILNQLSGKWGLQICKDMDFPALSREYAVAGADLMLVPAWDFITDGWLHSRMAVLRAVENGFALARSARNGLLTLSDSRGRILMETTTSPGQFVSISGIVKVVDKKTFYTRTGDWFAWLCVAAGIGLLAFRLLRRLPIAVKKSAA